MATEVIIGGGEAGTVRMYGCITRELEQVATYDASGTDLIAQTVRASFEGTVHAQGASNAGFTAGTTTFTTISPGDTNAFPSPSKIAILRGLMLTPRRPIYVYMNGVLALYAAPMPGANADIVRSQWIDIDNGPKPRGATITKIIGDNTFRIIFSFECNLIRCIQGTPVTGIGAWPVVNNRWSISESMDRDFFTKRTIRGALRLSTSLWPGHGYRALCVPALEDGFARESVEHEVAANGLDVTYQVTDTQVHTAAPWPATQMEAKHIEETADGVNFFSTMSVRLKGSPEASKTALIALAGNIVEARLHAIQALNDNTAYPTSVNISETIGAENVIELNMTLRRFQESSATQIFNLLNSKMGQPLELPQLTDQPDTYDPEKSRVPALWGYDPSGEARNPAVLLFLLSCYLQDPCSPSKGIYNRQAQQQTSAPDSASESQSQGRSASVVAVTPGTLNGGNFQNYSQAQKVAFYTLARMQSRYTIDSKGISLAIADSETVAADTAVVVQLSKGRCCRTISYDAERIGLPPQIPAASDTYADGDLKGTLLKHWFETHPPALSADGIKKIYRVTAFYRYGLNRPPKATEKIRVGVLPFTSFTQDENAYNLQDGINANLGP